MKLSMKLAPAVVALLLSGASPAAAVTLSTNFGVHDGWQVYSTTGGQCFMDASFAGTKITIYSTPDSPNEVSFAIQSPAWRSLVVGQKHPLRIELDNRSEDTTGIVMPAIGGGVWIAFGVNRASLGAFIASERKLAVSTGDKTLISLRERAIDASYVFSRCANQMAQGDPFAR